MRARCRIEADTNISHFTTRLEQEFFVLEGACAYL